jgi:eukaryotic-like serine/threonine-protein kinase
MSPESAAGGAATLGPRSDVYSLGATLYCLLTGRPPFEGDDIGAILRRVQDGDFRAPRDVDPALDKALEAVCKKAMATRPEDRYAGCRALAEDIERWTADEPVSAWREPITRRVRRWANRNRTAVASVAVALIAGVVGLSAVLAVQTQAKADVTRALAGERDANRALATSNDELARSRAAVQARYDLAVDAIMTFHTGVSEDFLLRQDQFKELRDRLLRSAQGFYGKLSALLGRQTDPAARRALAASNSELGSLLSRTGQPSAKAELRRAQAIERKLVDDNPTVTHFRGSLARSHTRLGDRLSQTGLPAEAEAEYRRARALYQDLVEKNPGVPSYRDLMASVDRNLVAVLRRLGRPGDVRAVCDRVIAQIEALVRENPRGPVYRAALAENLYNRGLARRRERHGRRRGRPAPGRRAVHGGDVARWREVVYLRVCPRGAGGPGQSGRLGRLGRRGRHRGRRRDGPPAQGRRDGQPQPRRLPHPRRPQPASIPRRLPAALDGPRVPVRSVRARRAGQPPTVTVVRPARSDDRPEEVLDSFPLTHVTGTGPSR